MTDTKTVTVGKKLIPLDHIALVEPFERPAHGRMRSDRAFQSRLLLVDRDSVLTEQDAAAFAEAHGFRMLKERVAVNPAVHFSVESFEPAEGFTPQKPYRLRLSWRDLDGNTQSKLLLAAPDTVLSIAVRGQNAQAQGFQDRQSPSARKSALGRRRRRSVEAPGTSPT